MARSIKFKVGTTRSGNSVYWQYCLLVGHRFDVLVQLFQSSDDYFDAHAIFEALALAEIRKSGTTEQYLGYAKLGSSYLATIKTPELAQIMRKLGLKHSIDVVNYGRALCLDRFKFNI